MIGNNYLVSVVDVTGQTIQEPVTIAQALEWLDNPDSSYQVMIESLITSVRRELENRYRMTICRRNREFFYSDYGTELSLHYGPHDSITSISTVDKEGTEEALTLGSDYSVYGSVYPMIRFDCPGQDIKIVSSSGFENDNVPKDIQTSVLMMVKYIFDGEWDEGEKFPKDVDRIMRYYDKHVV